MAEDSFPVIEKPLSDTQWKSVTKGIGNGALDEGGNPYRLGSMDNATNTGKIHVDGSKGYNHAILCGFYHYMDSDITVNLPPVSATTTYYIVLRYSPTDGAMPVRLVVVTSLDRTQGKEYLVLWTVRREPNQLLTNAQVTKVRPIIAPTIMVDTKDQLPAVESVLYGTRAWCYMTNEEYRAASANGWEPIGPRRVDVPNAPGWSVTSPTGGMVVSNISGGYLCQFTGNFAREGFQYDIPTTFHSMGVFIPVGYRPAANIYGLFNSNDDVGEYRISPDGTISLRSRGNTITMRPGKALPVSASWFVPKSWAL